MLCSDRPQKGTEEQSHCLPCWLSAPRWPGWVHKEWQAELTGKRHPTAMRLERALVQPPHAWSHLLSYHHLHTVKALVLSTASLAPWHFPDLALHLCTRSCGQFQVTLVAEGMSCRDADRESAPVSTFWHLLSPSSRWNRGQARTLHNTNNSTSKPHMKELFIESYFDYLISYIKKENVYTWTQKTFWLLSKSLLDSLLLLTETK